MFFGHIKIAHNRRECKLECGKIGPQSPSNYGKIFPYCRHEICGATFLVTTHCTQAFYKSGTSVRNVNKCDIILSIQNKFSGDFRGQQSSRRLWGGTQTARTFEPPFPGSFRQRSKGRSIRWNQAIALQSFAKIFVTNLAGELTRLRCCRLCLIRAASRF